jgi:hypothetical protein
MLLIKEITFSASEIQNQQQQKQKQKKSDFFSKYM